MTNEIHNQKDFIDSHDIIARIDELEDILNDHFECPNCEQSKLIIEFGDNEICPHCSESVFIDLDNEKSELETLIDLQEQCNYGDWEYGTTLIKDNCFEQYAHDLAKDTGAISQHDSWPTDYIDWDKATKALQQDYACVNFDEEDYWLRA